MKRMTGRGCGSTANPGTSYADKPLTPRSVYFGAVIFLFINTGAGRVTTVSRDILQTQTRSGHSVSKSSPVTPLLENDKSQRSEATLPNVHEAERILWIGTRGTV